MSPVTVTAARSNPAQRKIVRSLTQVLRDDLFKRVGSDPQFPGLSALWESPGKWRVSYGMNLDGTSVWCRIYGPAGPGDDTPVRFAEAEKLESADDAYTWLDGTLP